jgi:hypothetical protein
MTSKIAVAGRLFRSFGFAGPAWKVLVRLRIQAGQARLADRLIRRYSPYTRDPRETMKCPHCRGLLEKGVAGLLCRTCSDVFI